MIWYGPLRPDGRVALPGMLLHLYAGEFSCMLAVHRVVASPEGEAISSYVEMPVTPDTPARRNENYIDEQPEYVPARHGEKRI